MISWLMPRHRAIVNQDSYFEPFAHRTRAGIDINEDVALTFSTVFLCTRIICEPIAGLPIIAYEYEDDGDRKPVLPGTLAAQEVLAFPNEEMTAYGFRESRTQHQINWGGGFAELVRDRAGDVRELWPIHPSRVRPGKDGYAYAVRNDDGTYVGMRADEILHVCGPLSDDGIWSRGIISHARETVGGALAMDRHAWAYLGSGGQPKGIFKSPGLRSPEDKREFRKQWKEIHSNPDECEVVIAHKDSDYIPIQIPNDDHQFLASRLSNRKIICELYRVPTYMIGDRVLGASIEAQSSEFIMNTLAPWVYKWDQHLGMKLLNREQRKRYFFEHDFTAMLRGNVADRMNGYRVQITTGVRTINECRRLENLPGIGPAGDIHYIPANMFTADQMLHGNPSAGAGPGSDQTGAPADNPLDHEPTMDARHDAAMRKLRSDHRAEIDKHVRDMASQVADRKTDWKAVAKVALMDVLGRMLTKEANAAQRIVDSKDDLEKWMHEFYGRHTALLTEAFRPACAALALTGETEFANPANLAAWHVSRSTEALRAAYNSDSREAFAKRLKAWPTDRAKELTEQVLQRANYNPDQPRDEQGRFGDTGNEYTKALRDKEDEDRQSTRDKKDDADNDRRGKEDKDRQDAHDEEDAEISDKRYEEDLDREEARESADKVKTEQRAKEDQELTEQRAKEDEQIEEKQAVLEKEYEEERGRMVDADASEEELADFDQAYEDAMEEVSAWERPSEDKQREKVREKEDEAEEKRREKEDALIEKKREREDKQREKAREKEDRKIERLREREDDADRMARASEDKAVDERRKHEDSKVK